MNIRYILFYICLISNAFGMQDQLFNYKLRLPSNIELNLTNSLIPANAQFDAIVNLYDFSLYNDDPSTKHIGNVILQEAFNSDLFFAAEQLEQLKNNNSLNGKAVLSDSFNLINKGITYIIHTSPLIKSNEDLPILKQTYENILVLAEKNKLSSLIIPYIIGGLPIKTTAQLVIQILSYYNFSSLKKISLYFNSADDAENFILELASFNSLREKNILSSKYKGTETQQAHSIIKPEEEIIKSTGPSYNFWDRHATKTDELHQIYDKTVSTEQKYQRPQIQTTHAKQSGYAKHVPLVHATLLAPSSSPIMHPHQDELLTLKPISPISPSEKNIDTRLGTFNSAFAIADLDYAASLEQADSAWKSTSKKDDKEKQPRLLLPAVAQIQTISPVAQPPQKNPKPSSSGYWSRLSLTGDEPQEEIERPKRPTENTSAAIKDKKAISSSSKEKFSEKLKQLSTAAEPYRAELQLNNQEEINPWTILKIDNDSYIEQIDLAWKNQRKQWDSNKFSRREDITIAKIIFPIIKQAYKLAQQMHGFEARTRVNNLFLSKFAVLTELFKRTVDPKITQQETPWSILGLPEYADEKTIENQYNEMVQQFPEQSEVLTNAKETALEMDKSYQLTIHQPAVV